MEKINKKHITTYLNAEQANSLSEEQQKSSTLDSINVEGFFKELSGIYGNVFKAKFQTDEEMSLQKRQWSDMLKEFSREQILQAFTEMKHDFRFTQYPPNVLQFGDLCRSVRTTPHASHKMFQLEEKKGDTVDKDTISRDVANLRKLLA